ncbi:uncharacterized protein LOC114679448 isoform X3 [Macaca mulatta]
MAEERVAMSSSNSSSLHAPQSWYQELEVALDSSSATINQLNENVESLYRRIQGSDQPLAIFLAAYWRVGAGSLCCLHAAAGRGQGDEGGHLDTEEEEVPQPMSSILEDLESREAMCEKILKLTADAKFELGDVKATVAVLSFVLSSVAKHSVDGRCFSSELQQLGLPKGTQGQLPTATSRATPFYPQSTWPACATVMRRNKAPCRSTWGLQPTQQV